MCPRAPGLRLPAGYPIFHPFLHVDVDDIVDRLRCSETHSAQSYARLPPTQALLSLRAQGSVAVHAPRAVQDRCSGVDQRVYSGVPGRVGYSPGGIGGCTWEEYSAQSYHWS